MSNQVYANGMEVACKAADGKTAAAMPDVCLSPPSPPAGPVPIPYPNTAYASDTTDGSKTVQISGQEVVLKDKSTFKKSTGDEAATKSLGMGVVSHQIQGKANFASWSMDVKIEGENAARHLDLMLHNEMSSPPNTPPWVYTDAAATQPIRQCRKEVAKSNAACKGKDTKDAQCADKACRDSKKCLLVMKRQADSKAQNSRVACCSNETGHHLVEAHGFCVKGSNQTQALPQFPKYDAENAPCVCAECPKVAGRYEGHHGFLHAIQGKLEMAAMEAAPPAQRDYAWTYSQSRSAGVRALQQTFPRSKCSKKCLQAQLDSYHKGEVGASDNTRVRTETPDLTADQKELANVVFVPKVTLKAW